MVRRSTKVLDHPMTSWCLAVGSLMLYCVYRLSQVMVRRSTKVLDHTMMSWCLAVGSLMLYCVSTD